MVIKCNQIGPSIFTFEPEVHQAIISRMLETADETILQEIWENTRNYHIEKKRKYHEKIYRKSPAATKDKFRKNAVDMYNKCISTKKIAGNKLPSQIRLTDSQYADIKITVDYFDKDPKNKKYWRWCLDLEDNKPFSTGVLSDDCKRSYDKRKGDASAQGGGGRSGSVQIGGASPGIQLIMVDIGEFNVKFVLSSRDGLLEAGLGITDKQCLESCGKKPNPGVTFSRIWCYICGEKIFKNNGSVPGGSQCEHLVPVCAMAMLCGLSGADYEDTIDRYFQNEVAEGRATIVSNDGAEDIVLNNVDGSGIQISREQLREWREYLIGNNQPEEAGDLPGQDPVTARNAEITRACGGGWMYRGVLYRWAHGPCNIMKSNFPFLALEWDVAENDDEWETLKSAGYPYLNPDAFVEESEVGKVVGNLAGEVNGGRDGGGSYSKGWQKTFLNSTKLKNAKFKFPAGAPSEHDRPPKLGDQSDGRNWIRYRMEAMANKTLKWAKDVILYTQDAYDEGVRFHKWTGTTDLEEIQPESEEWSKIRSALCVTSINILDFRVEDKMKDHYQYKTLRNPISDEQWKGIIEQTPWRTEGWINYVGEGGGKKNTSIKGGGGIDFLKKKQVKKLKNAKKKLNDARRSSRRSNSKTIRKLEEYVHEIERELKWLERHKERIIGTGAAKKQKANTTRRERRSSQRKFNSKKNRTGRRSANVRSKRREMDFLKWNLGMKERSNYGQIKTMNFTRQYIIFPDNSKIDRVAVLFDVFNSTDTNGRITDFRRRAYQVISYWKPIMHSAQKVQDNPEATQQEKTDAAEIIAEAKKAIEETSRRCNFASAVHHEERIQKSIQSSENVRKKCSNLLSETPTLTSEYVNFRDLTINSIENQLRAQLRPPREYVDPGRRRKKSPTKKGSRGAKNPPPESRTARVASAQDRRKSRRSSAAAAARAPLLAVSEEEFI